MTINYVPGQIEASLAAINTQKNIFNESAEGIGSLFKELADLSEGNSITEALATQQRSAALRAENEANVAAVVTAAQRSLQKAQENDARATATIA